MRLLFKLAIFLAVIGIAAGMLLQAYPTMSISAKTFLWSIKEGNFDMAYAQTSANIQKRYSMREFVENMRKIGLDKYQDYTLDTSVTSPDQKAYTLTGIVETTDGKRIILRLKYIAETSDSFFKARWAIDSIEVLN